LPEVLIGKEVVELESTLQATQGILIDSVQEAVLSPKNLESRGTVFSEFHP
jgi:hypothetical protein